MAANALRSFQNEIDELQRQSLAKKRLLPQAASDKENKDPSNAAVPPSTVAEGEHAQEDDLIDEADLQRLISSEAEADRERAKDVLSRLLTSHKGEYIIRFGTRPPHLALFFNDESGGPAAWTGTALTEGELKQLCDAVILLAEEVGGKASLLYSITTGHPRAALLLRLPPPDVSLTAEVRCAVVGNVDSGKSTTLGVLTRGGLDDGRGRARVGLFRHKHELETGRTSSIGMEILGFDTSGKPILPSTAASLDQDVIRREKLGWDEITQQAAKVVSFIDLAGHEKYLKTTLYGLTSGAPHCVMLMVGGNAGVIGMSREHLGISFALRVPVVVCVTKIDMTPPNVLNDTLKQLQKLFKSAGVRKSPVFVKSLESAVEVSQVFMKENLCPIFQVSNVTGEGLDLVRTFLNLLPSDAHKDRYASDLPLEYSITEVWSVPYVGTVVNGIINSGSLKTGDAIYLGPDSNGNWHTTAIKSIQRKRAPVNNAEAGQCVSIALKRMRRTAVRKGMVILHKTDVPPESFNRFVAEVLILQHNTTLSIGYQAMLHCGAIRQTVKIVSMENRHYLRTGDRCSVEFEFVSHPEFIRTEMKLLFREGKTKGIGAIKRLVQDNEPPAFPVPGPSEYVSR